MLNNKILIIDDSNVAVKFTQKILKDEEYEMVSASNGKEGLELFENERPVLIILDMNMPVMTGVEFLERIKLKPSDPYTVIVLTGNSDEEEIKKCFDLGVSFFIEKPFNIHVFKGMLKNCISLKETQFQLKKYSTNLEKMVQDRTKELQKAYNDLKTSQKMVYQQEKMASLGLLAAGVAHEINNPTGFISSNIYTFGKYIKKINEFIYVQKSSIESNSSEEIIKDISKERRRLKIDYILEDVENLITESIDGTDRIKKMVQDLKIFSRQKDEQLDEADINECIESSLNIVWNELKYKSVVNKELGNLPPIRCYQRQLNQVFMNILVNACQAIEVQGEINIKTFEKGNSVFISISDTGCGIPDKHLDKIFDPFFTTKEEGKGTGLGMSITYEIIKKHNGDITIKSEVGKGTTFIIELPIKNDGLLI